MRHIVWNTSDENIIWTKFINIKWQVIIEYFIIELKAGHS